MPSIHLPPRQQQAGNSHRSNDGTSSYKRKVIEHPQRMMPKRSGFRGRRIRMLMSNLNMAAIAVMCGYRIGWAIMRIERISKALGEEIAVGLAERQELEGTYELVPRPHDQTRF